MADPNNVVLSKLKLAFMLPCKVANTSIKAAIADSLGQERGRLHRAGRFDCRHKQIIDTFGADWLVVGFVRNPYGRFMSAYRHKVRDEGLNMRPYGLGPAPTIEDIAGKLDRIDNQHWRSLTEELAIDGRIIPSVVARAETMDSDWATLSLAVKWHCGLTLAPLPRLNETEGAEVLTAPTRYLIADHYAEDFRLFGYEP